MKDVQISGSMKVTAWPEGRSYELKGMKVTVSAPVVLGRSTTEFWFPQVLRLDEDEVLAAMHMEADTFEGNESGQAALLWSADGGLTWSERRNVRGHGFSQVVLPSGDTVFLPVMMYPRAEGIGGPCNVLPKGKREVRASEVLVTGWPRAILTALPSSSEDREKLKHAPFYFDGQSVKLKDGKYLATLYGHLAEPGDEKLVSRVNNCPATADGRIKRYCVVAAESADGFNWKIRSIIADEQCKLPGAEGPCEPTLCRLADGRLMCVFRLDGCMKTREPYGQCWSSDEGRTWTEPVGMADIGSVEPSLAVLKNGAVALSGGRPGVFLWLSADGSATTWQSVDLLAHHNSLCPADAINAQRELYGKGASTSYTETLAVDDRHLLVIYDRTPLGMHGPSAPKSPADAPDPRETFACYVVRVTVEKRENAKVAEIGSKRQFWFNAQNLVAESRDLKIVQHQPAKHPANPFLVADKPWEGGAVQLYSADVHYDPATGQWQMWYEGHPTEVLLCTAFSRDGIKWTKPSLGLQEYQGSRANNIILQTGYLDAHCASIVKAPTEKDPAKKYKLYYWVGPEWFDAQVKAFGLKPDDAAVVESRRKMKPYKVNGHYVAFSADGVDFTPQLEAPALPVSDFNTTLFDERTGRYRSYHKIERKKPGWEGPRRCMSMAESEDGVHFTPSVPVLDPTPEDDAWAKSLGGKRVEFYGMHVWPCEDFYLGLVWIFRITGVDPERGMGWDDGYIVPYLMYSPDGINWNRMPEREPFIPPGPAGSFESGSVYNTGDHPVVIGDEVRFYYFGVSYTHGCTGPIDSPKFASGFGLATLGRDRYVAWQGGSVAGTLRTRGLTFHGRELHLNLDAGGGETRVALLDAAGQPLAGLGLEDCEPIRADGFDQVVKWRGASDLSALAGKVVRLQFTLRQSALYTWQFK